MASYGTPRPNPAIVYQIDFSAVASGKRIASTKRRVRWRFGFANMQALESGLTGTECRGEEHDITLVWSVTSGKRTIIQDGQEIHFSSSRAGVFEHSWTMRGNHVLKITAHASPPLSPTPGFRQYDFYVDGQSFFRFPKVFRLGLSPNDPRGLTPRDGGVLAESSSRYASPTAGGGNRPRSSNIASLEAPTNPQEEEEYLKEAIRQSLQDSKPLNAPSGGGGGGDLLDFGGPAPVPQAPALPPSTTPVASDPFGYSAPAPSPWASQAPQPSYPAIGYGGSAAPAPALPPSTTAPNPFESPPAPAVASYGGSYPTAASSSGNQTSVQPAPSYGATPYSYGGPSQTSSFSQGPQVPQQQPQQSAYSQPPQTAATGYPAPPQQESQKQWSAPPPIQTQGYGNQYNVPSSVTPQAQQTPSSLGFQSPVPDFSGFSPQPTHPQPQTIPESFSEAEPEPVPEFAPAPAEGMSMNELYGSGGLVESTSQTPGSLADKAYNKLASLDTFSLVAESSRSNPFDSSANVSSSIHSSVSLSDMKKSKDGQPKKEIMRSSNSMVVSQSQPSYGSQYGIGAGVSGQTNEMMQQPQPSMQSSPVAQQYQQPSNQSAQYTMPQQSYGAPQQNGQAYGQQYSQQPLYGAQQSAQAAPQSNPVPNQPYQQQQLPYGGQNPYGQPQQNAAPQSQPNPYGQPQHGFSGTPQQAAYGQPQQTAYQYGQPQQNPYGQSPF